MTEIEIKQHLDKFHDYDIRTNHNCRFVDQKCTPDVVSFIADCILCSKCANEPFTIKDLWNTPYFIENTRVIFHKPSAQNTSAHNEYDKVLSQPLKLLAYAHILQIRAEHPQTFNIQNRSLLEHIAQGNRNALRFLTLFFKKVIIDSGIERFFTQYFDDCIKDAKSAKETLYNQYHRFVSANTPTKSKKDSDRMLHKVLNIFAFEKLKPGSNGKVPELYDLMYNRINWRDKGTGKSKFLTRNEAKNSETDEINQNFYIAYQVNKAIRYVKKQQGDVSEVKDELAAGIATEVHHIFPKSQFPQISSFFENLILLTGSQHRQKAHPNGNTQFADPDYQIVCLMAKSKTIEDSLKNGETFYRRESFVYVLNTGFNENLDADSEFANINKFLVHKLQK